MKTVIVTVVTLATIGIGYFTTQIFNQWMKNQAVDTCLTVAKTETTITGDPQTQVFTAPDGAWYEKCLKDKGY